VRKAYYEDQGITLYHGDCLDVMAEMPENSVDTVITDPPSGISFMSMGWDSDKGGRDKWIAWLTSVLEQCCHVMKPGGALLVWSIPRTSHWTGTAVENAGFRVIDVIQHIFGSGFPKSHDISKALDKAAGVEREVVGRKCHPTSKDRTGNKSPYQANDCHLDGCFNITAPTTDAAKLWRGWGSALKPAAESWWLAYKPRDGTFAQNALRWGVAGLWIDGGRIPINPTIDDPRLGGAGDWSSAKMAKNVYEGGYAGVRVGSHEGGRWPANVILDEEAGAMLDKQTGTLTSGKCPNGFKGEYTANVYGEYAKNVINPEVVYGDSGGASRFFYCAKSPRRERWFHCSICSGVYPMAERDDHKHDKEKRDHITSHPTQKPLGLMEYLCRLTKTPTGGIVLDPFAGSGSTLVAAGTEGREAIGIEIDEDYCKIAAKRLAKQASKWKQKGLFA
jgi:site-specific DNA-methyltransferase (adenine-specific)